jgi:hypothetical protein
MGMMMMARSGSLALLLSALFFCGPVQAQQIQGDVNFDGAVNVLDVQAVINQALAISPTTTEGDVNVDGAVNVLDVQRCLNIALGIGPPPIITPTLSDYRVAVTLPLSGLMGGNGITGLAYDADGEVLYACGTGAKLIALDLPAPYTQVKAVRFVSPGSLNALSSPLGLTFTRSRTELSVLDFNSGSGAGRARVVEISAGPDGVFGSNDDFRIGQTVLPVALDTAVGISFSPTRGEYFIVTTRLNSGGVEEVAVMDESLSQIKRTLDLKGLGVDNPTGVAVCEDRLLVINSKGEVTALTIDSGVAISASQDPAMRIALDPTVTQRLTQADGICGAFSASAVKQSEEPLFFGNFERNNEKVVVLVEQ